MAKRNPNSEHQLIMTTLFGDEAAKLPTTWSKWPEPQRSIYKRMFANGLTIADSQLVKAANKMKDSLCSK